MSYNTLSNDLKKCKYTKKFINDICSFFGETDVLNHLGISGMNIQPEGLIKLCEALSCCPKLLAIHMNDNQILDPTSDHLLREILAIFDLGEYEVDETCWVKKMTNQTIDQNFIKEKIIEHLEQKE